MIQRLQRREGRRQALGLQLEDLLGRPPSVSRCRPRSSSHTPAGSEPPSSPAAAADTTTCPPCATAAIRAAPRTSTPASPATVRDASPQSMPIRTRTPGRPLMGDQRPLHPDRRARTRPRRGEHRRKLTTPAAGFLAAMHGQARPDQPPIISQHPRIRVPQPLPHRGRILDVGEQERQRLRGHQPGLLIEMDANRIGQKTTGLRNSRGQTIIRPPPLRPPDPVSGPAAATSPTSPISAPRAAMLPGEPHRRLCGFSHE